MTNVLLLSNLDRYVYNHIESKLIAFALFLVLLYKNKNNRIPATMINYVYHTIKSTINTSALKFYSLYIRVVVFYTCILYVKEWIVYLVLC